MPNSTMRVGLLAAVVFGMAAGLWMAFGLMDGLSDGGTLLDARDVVTSAAFAVSGVAMLLGFTLLLLLRKRPAGAT